MDLLETYYDKKSFTFFGLFAAIPGKNARLRKFFVVVSVLLLTASTIAQALKLSMGGFTINLIIEVVPMNTATGGTLVHVLYTVFVSSEDFNRLLSVMRNDLLEERNAADEAIKRRFADDANHYIKLFLCIFILGVCMIWCSGFIPRILDSIIPLNETRPNLHILNGEIFIDQEKYYYQVYFIECCTIFVVAAVVGASETVSVIIVQHVSSMFAETGHQLENITETKDHPLRGVAPHGYLVAHNLHKCIVRHQRTLWFAHHVVEFYDVPLTIVLISTFCAFTVSLVQVTDPQLINAEVAGYTGIQVCQFFIVSYMGQFMIDSSEQLMENACNIKRNDPLLKGKPDWRGYNAKWDICEPHIRPLLQMVILRSSKPCPVVARGMFVLSIESFMSVLQTAMSFYVVLNQAS